MNTIERTADKIADIIKADGLRGVAFITKPGSKEMIAAICANAFQTGALLGAGIIQLTQDALAHDEYDKFMIGLLSDVEQALVGKEILERLATKRNAEDKS